jgi:phage tail-like protein
MMPSRLQKWHFQTEKDLRCLYDIFRMNALERSRIIRLLDDAANPVITWALIDAFPVTMSVTDMKSDGGATAVETMEVAHARMTFEAA